MAKESKEQLTGLGKAINYTMLVVGIVGGLVVQNAMGHGGGLWGAVYGAIGGGAGGAVGYLLAKATGQVVKP